MIMTASQNQTENKKIYQYLELNYVLLFSV